MDKPEKQVNIGRILLFLFCGMLIGVGAVIPGVSGGVLCVMFGIYRPIMDFLSHPILTLKKKADIILPAVIGIAVGFLLISKLLGFLLDAYPEESVCVFVGLIFGMLPSLFAEAGERGRSKKAYAGMVLAFLLVLGGLTGLGLLQITMPANFFSYLFCGFCVALSIIVPGMSFSTLLMPLDLYEPMIKSIGDLDLQVLFPLALGAVATILLLSKLVEFLLGRHYAGLFHAIVGVVMAATIVIIPFDAFGESLPRFFLLSGCILISAVLSYFLSLLNNKVDKKSA